jgi:hypothetical protein
MGVHGVQGLGQVTGSAIKKMFPSTRAPEGVTVKAALWLRTQFYVLLKTVFLKNPNLHAGPHFLGIIVDATEGVIPQMRYSRAHDPARHVFWKERDSLKGETRRAGHLEKPVV